MVKQIRRRVVQPARALEESELHPLLAKIYAARGLSAPNELDLGLDQLIPPEQLLNAPEAAVLLADAIAGNERILVVGDFDADGATSTALFVEAMRAFGAQHVDYLVPNRFEYGYGLTPEIVELARGSQPDLIVTVDNGISSIEGVDAASALGIRTVITDHHLAGNELPKAQLIVNPNQPACTFPSGNLAGVGVIFYLMMALRQEFRRRDASSAAASVNLAQFLDLVALGTVADVVPLDRNNRILVSAGLRRIRAGQARPGIMALLGIASRDFRSMVASDLGFAVGPRINAAGRLDDMSVGIECLLSTSESTAQKLAAQLQQLNDERRVIERDMQKTAMQIIAHMPFSDDEEPPIAMCLYQSDWHQGVIGILASRIKDKLHRPTIAFADGDAGQLKGSARSIPGIHIRDILDAVATRNPGLISRFGGHAMAAGLTIDATAYEPFVAAFTQEVHRHAEDVQLQAVIESDGAIDAADFDLELAQTLRFAGPWGQHFPEPVFDGEFDVINQRLVGERHLKVVLSPDGGATVVDGIAFNIDPEIWPNASVERVQIAYRLDVNEFRGRRSLQLMIEHLFAA
ncbi:MAG: single-stranded-DNA-specific exonuclease RecJ [Halioglobus sp.]